MHPWLETAHNKSLPLPTATSDVTQRRVGCFRKDASPEHFVPLAKIKTDMRICLSAAVLDNNNHTKISLSMLSCILIPIFMVFCLLFHHRKKVQLSRLPTDSCLYSIFFLYMFFALMTPEFLCVLYLLISYKTC